MARSQPLRLIGESSGEWDFHHDVHREQFQMSARQTWRTIFPLRYPCEPLRARYSWGKLLCLQRRAGRNLSVAAKLMNPTKSDFHMQQLWSLLFTLYPLLVGAIGGFFGALLALPTRFAEMAFKSRLDRQHDEYKNQQAHLLEHFKQELKSRDDQIASVRALALAPLGAKSEILTKRRIQAAESIWASVLEYRRYRHLVESTHSLKMKEAMETASQKTPDGEKIRSFAATLIKSFGIENFKFEASPDLEAIFINPNVWARFSVYRSVMTLPISRLLAMREGMGPSFIKDQKPLVDAAKSVLPHMSGFIDEYGDEGLSYLHDLFEDEVKTAIVASFSDLASDAEHVEQVALIIRNVNKADFGSPQKIEIPVPALINEPASLDATKSSAKRIRKLTKYIPHSE
jgi:hypothetical protein